MFQYIIAFNYSSDVSEWRRHGALAKECILWKFYICNEKLSAFYLREGHKMTDFGSHVAHVNFILHVLHGVVFKIISLDIFPKSATLRPQPFHLNENLLNDIYVIDEMVWSITSIMLTTGSNFKLRISYLMQFQLYAFILIS